MKKFDPKEHNFVRIERENPWNISLYEFNNTDSAGGKPDFCKLNIYLSKDGNFVKIWHGLFDAAIAEAELEQVEKPSQFDLSEQYDTQLFRGYIDSNDNAEIILKSLHFEELVPQRLSGDDYNKIRCDAIA